MEEEGGEEEEVEEGEEVAEGAADISEDMKDHPEGEVASQE